MAVNEGNVFDVKSILRPEGVFLSYWLDTELLVLAGDNRGVHIAEWVQVEGLLSLIMEFEEQVLNQQYYRKFIAEKIRPYHDNEVLNDVRPIDKILLEIFSLIIPPSVYSFINSGAYKKLVVFPDGHIHLLPFHLLTSKELGSTRLYFPEGICYSTSASCYAYACAKKVPFEPSLGIIAVGDPTNKDMLNEAESVSKALPFESKIISKLEDLQRLSGSANLLYFITHGHSPASTDSEKVMNANGLSQWSLVFEGNRVGEMDFFNNRIPIKNGAIVVLSACSIGHIMPGRAHEIEGLLNALFYSGASTVLSARWPVPGLASSAVFGDTIKNLFKRKSNISASFTKAIRDASQRPELIELMDSPESYIFFWGPYALYGNSVSQLIP